MSDLHSVIARRRRRHVLLALTAALLVSPAAFARGSSHGTAFRNPIAPTLASGQDSPDPWIFTFRGRYWLTTSAQTIALRSATTLGGLANASLRTMWPPSGTPLPMSRCCEFWAPEFHRLRGPHGVRWYIYSAVDDGNLSYHRIQVLQSTGDDPRGPYHFMSILGLGENYAIDPTVFTLHGDTYVVYSGGPGNVFVPTSLYIARLSNPWTVATAPVVISQPTLPWERIGLPINEGPEALIHGQWLNIIYSGSWCALPTYSLGRLTVRTSADLLDPATWVRAKAPEPIFHEDPARGVYGTGHGSFFKSPDGRQDWQVYHATGSSAHACTLSPQPRTTRAQPFTWNRNGTPDFGRPVSLNTNLAAPSGDPTLERQFENARVVSEAGASSSLVIDSHFIGYQARVIKATHAGGAVSFDMSLPKPGRYRLLLRIGSTSTGGRVRVRLAQGHENYPQRTINSYSTRTAYPDINIGLVALRAGSFRLRFVLRDAGEQLTLDQLRLERIDT